MSCYQQASFIVSLCDNSILPLGEDYSRKLREARSARREGVIRDFPCRRNGQGQVSPPLSLPTL